MAHMQPFQEREAQAAEIAGTVAGVVDVLFADLRAGPRGIGKESKGKDRGKGQGRGKRRIV